MPTYSISTIGYPGRRGSTTFLRCDKCEREIHQFDPPGPNVGNLYGVTADGVKTLIPEMVPLIQKHEEKCQ